MKIFDKKELKVLWPFYTDCFWGTILFILIPFQIIYFSSIGLSATRIGILIGIVPLISIISEIPTGAIADLYGRKFSVLLGWVLAGISLIIVPISNNYYYLLFTAAFSGFSMTFVSGASDAWVVDLLKAKKMDHYIKEFFMKRMSLYNLAFIFSGVLGSLSVALFGLKSIWIISGITLILSSIILSFGEEKYKIQKPNLKKSFVKILNQSKDSISYSFKHHVLFYLFLITFFMAISANLSQFISLTPFLKSFNFPDYAFGILWSAMALIGVIAPFATKKFSKGNNEKKILVWITIFSLFLGFFILFLNNLVWILVVIMISSFIADMGNPLWSTYFHRFIPSKKRATIGSIWGMISSLGAIIGIPLAGYLVDSIGARYTIFISYMMMIIILFIYSRIKEKCPT